MAKKNNVGVSGRESKGVNIDKAVVDGIANATLLSRIGGAARYIISGVTPNTWMSPQQPLAPIADGPEQGTRGRRFDLRVGGNQNARPRAEENVSFEQLRSLADSYDIMRLILETRKDQIEAFEWEIVPSRKGSDMDAQCEAMSKFFKNPSFEHDWGGWLRCIMEDLLVLDAVAIYPRRTLGGDLVSLDLVDGATIKKLIDETGRIPMAPNPAYQQVLKGVAAQDYTTDELLYFMRNPRTSRVYGLSPVEQVIMTVNIALRRQIHQLQYYTEGNVPEAIVGVPDTWTAEEIADFQGYFDDMLSGNTAARRRITFIPSDASKMQFTREPTLKDSMDEWLIRIVCFAFSISPTAFVAQVNRAVAESSSDSAKEEGLIPLLAWVKRRIDFIISNVIGVDGVEFKWKMSDNLSADIQSAIDREDIKAGVKTIDEVRIARGESPLENGLGSRPMVMTGSGMVLLEACVASSDATTKAAKSDQANHAAGSAAASGQGGGAVADGGGA